ncbi:MAG: DUF1616 domain-containing protein [Thermoplasmata archaeon]|jgi:hypothetical protein|nr:DUF1616 domain-containing protein [Thermoplasmata archaeon]
MSNPIQIILGLAVVFFLPGYTLVNLLFPRKGELDPDLDVVYRITLGMGSSVVLSMLVGFVLNAFSDEDTGLVSPGPLWASLLSITGLFFLGGWYRGAYPELGLAHPSLYRPPGTKGFGRSGAAEFARSRRLERLVRERERLLVDLKTYSERADTPNPKRKAYYSKRTESVREQLAAVNEELKKPEPRRK